MTKRIIYWILLLLLLADLAYSFAQHMNQPLDGDMAGGIVPAEDVKPILEDPLGISVVTENSTYPNPNRFFSHWAFKEYFTTAPLLLQSFVEPVDSIYLSCAIAKIIIQAAIIFLLAFYITGTGNPLKLEFILAALLVAPLFQVNGYRSYMGIIDPATTYNFFYALPLALLLLYFLPFFRSVYHQGAGGKSWLIKILWIPFALALSLSGPLNPGIVLVLGIIMIPVVLKSNYDQLKLQNRKTGLMQAMKMIPGNYWFYLLPIGLFSLYSLYIGQFNSVSIQHKVPLMQLYAKLPEGIFAQFTQKLGFPLLFAILLVNTIIIRKKYHTAEGKKILAAFRWIGLFALIYILLLPLGGARDYRPNVLRYDTIMPINLALMFIFGATTVFLFKSMSANARRWYIPAITAVLLAFTLADRPELEKNDCEKIALETIAASTAGTIPTQYDCTVLSWNKTLLPHEAVMNERLLRIWRVLPREGEE